jgi:hypothetical protein
MRTAYFLRLFLFFLASGLIARGEDILALHTDPADSNRATATVEVRDFEIRVDNRTVATHRLTIKTIGETHLVKLETDLKVNLIVSAYSVKFRGTEVWHKNRLETAELQSEEAGKKRSFALKTDGEIQQISFNGKPVPATSLRRMTTPYWRLPLAELLTKPLMIIDVDSGTTHAVQVKIIEKTPISVTGQSRECQHLKIEGPSPADLWFDDQQRLVRQKSVESGHQLELRIKQIQLNPDDH